MNKKHIHLLIGLVIITLSLFYAFSGVKISELGNALLTAHYIYLVPAIALVILSYLFRAMRWRYLIHSIKEVSTASLFSPLLVGFVGNILPARAGEFIRAYLLSRKEQISFSASFATIFVEKLMDMLMFLLLLVGVLFFSADTFSRGDAGGNQRLMGYMIKFGWISFIGSMGIFLFSVLLQYKNEWAINIIDFCTKPLPRKWRDKIIEIVHSFTEGLKILKDLRGFMASLFLSIMVWTTGIFVFYPLLWAFGIETGLPVITAVIIIDLTVDIFISLFPTPGFLGSFQAACVIALHDIFGISKAVAASFGIIAWLVLMGFIILAGSIFIVKDHLSFSELASSREQVK